MENNSWNKSGGTFTQTTISNNLVPKLFNHVYSINYHPKFGYSLIVVEEKFTFPYKVYTHEEKFVKRIVKTYNNISKNLGILLNGVKGTGKSVTAKQICNELNLPVILVSKNTPDLVDFLISIQQECVLFIDEFEKVFDQDEDEQKELLSMMDGARESVYKRVFLLTTNNLYVDNNLLDRPSRIRYLKSYKNLSPEIVELILEDLLVNKELHSDVFEYIKTLELISMDVVKAVIEEVNIHNDVPEHFTDIFNATVLTDTITVTELTSERDVIISRETHPSYFRKYLKINNPLDIDGMRDFGIITSISKDKTEIMTNDGNSIRRFVTTPSPKCNLIFQKNPLTL